MMVRRLLCAMGLGLWATYVPFTMYTDQITAAMVTLSIAFVMALGYVIAGVLQRWVSDE